MTTFYFVRHGEPNYRPIEERGFIGHGRDLAPLTERGIQQLKATSRDERLKGCNVIVSSPYTRAMQSAAILSKELGLDLQVEVDLHEWLPDRTFNYKIGELKLLSDDFSLHKGVYPNNEERRWESAASIIERVKRVLDEYAKYDKVILVCHGTLIRIVTGHADAAQGEIIEFVS